MLANIHFYISLKLPLLSFSAAAKSELTLCVVLKPNERILVLILILILIPYVFQTFFTLIYWLS